MTTAAPASRNRVLAGLPTRTYERLLPLLEPVALAVGDTTARVGEPSAHVYFPLSCALSLLTGVRGGMVVQALSIGNEGLSGLSALVDGATAPWTVVCGIPGAALRVPAAGFVAAVARHPALRQRVLRYAQARFFQAAQAAVCNALHPVPQRCAQWLLRAHDQVGNDRFPVTQEALAAMLGVRRATVSTTLRDLGRRGAARYGRGSLIILDRAVLEAHACPCYRLIAEEFARLLG